MKHNFTVTFALCIGLLLSGPSSALTMPEFMAICGSVDGKCEDHPLLQAYVGGALDLIAMLDEETEYLDAVYCKSPKELFDVASIIQFMERERVGHGKRNAMLLVIRYLEEQGGC